MATKKQGRRNGSVAEGVAGAALAAAAAGAAAYYFYGTAKAKKHRHAASLWAKGLKRDVEKGVRNLKKVDAASVARVVDEAAAGYQNVRGATKTDVGMAAHELKRNWSRIKSELAPSTQVRRVLKKATGAAKKAVRSAKRISKKPSKKTPSKKKGVKKRRR